MSSLSRDIGEAAQKCAQKYVDAVNELRDVSRRLMLVLETRYISSPVFVLVSYSVTMINTRKKNVFWLLET